MLCRTNALCLQGLQLLHDDLVTMETLVYECHIDDELTFEDMKTMPHIDRLRLMMSCVSGNWLSKTHCLS